MQLYLFREYKRSEVVLSHTEQLVKAKAYAAATEEDVISSKVPTIAFITCAVPNSLRALMRIKELMHRLALVEANHLFKLMNRLRV